MAILVDSDVMIHLRDGDDVIAARIRERGERLIVSIVTRIELENGVYRDAAWRDVRRAAIDRILSVVETLDFDQETLAAYRRIVEQIGYARGRVNDRMIAATALVHGLPLITMNGADYRNVPGLDLEVWPTPTPVA